MTKGIGMLARLGNVVYWLYTGLAVLFGIIAIGGFVVVSGIMVLIYSVLAIVAWLIGRAARYITTGK